MLARLLTVSLCSVVVASSTGCLTSMVRAARLPKPVAQYQYTEVAAAWQDERGNIHVHLTGIVEGKPARYTLVLPLGDFIARGVRDWSQYFHVPATALQPGWQTPPAGHPLPVVVGTRGPPVTVPPGEPGVLITFLASRDPLLVYQASQPFAGPNDCYRVWVPAPHDPPSPATALLYVPAVAADVVTLPVQLACGLLGAVLKGLCPIGRVC